MFCNKCGKELIPGARFCLECGAALDENIIKTLEEENKVEEAQIDEKKTEPETTVKEKMVEPDVVEEQPENSEKDENVIAPAVEMLIDEEKSVDDISETSEAEESKTEVANAAVLIELQAINSKMDVIIDLLKQHDTRLLVSEEQIADIKDTIKNMKIVFGD